jgi:hypothetical protein
MTKICLEILRRASAPICNRDIALAFHEGARHGIPTTGGWSRCSPSGSGCCLRQHRDAGVGGRGRGQTMIDGEIERTEKQLRRLRDALEHIGETLRLFAPDAMPELIRPKVNTPRADWQLTVSRLGAPWTSCAAPTARSCPRERSRCGSCVIAVSTRAGRSWCWP